MSQNSNERPNLPLVLPPVPSADEMPDEAGRHFLYLYCLLKQVRKFALPYDKHRADDLQDFISGMLDGVIQHINVDVIQLPPWFAKDLAENQSKAAEAKRSKAVEQAAGQTPGEPLASATLTPTDL